MLAFYKINYEEENILMTKKNNDLVFEIKGKEHELKLTLASVRYLNKLHEGGAFILIQKALSGDIDTYIDIVYASLFHTDKGYKRADVEKAVDAAITEEKLDMDTINRTSYSVMAESFFYKNTLQKVFKADPEAQKQLEELML